MPHALKHFFEEIACGKAPGPSPTFSVFHLILAIDFIAEKTIGRNKLAGSLGIGGGAVRTIIERLKNAGLIEISKAGCSLTARGLKTWEDFRSVFKKVEVGKSELVSGKYNFAVLVRDCGAKVKSGMEQRDAAIMSGARSATTMVMRRGRLIIPSVSNDVAKDFPEAAKQVTRLLDAKENDVVVIGSADSPLKARDGTFAAAWTLLNNC
jgi:predicted transcriptional regulator